MNREPQNIYLIDGNSLCYRAYYAIRELSTSKGVPTNAVYGFINILRKLINDYTPGSMAVVFDMKGPTVRHKKYADYKAHRKPMPDDLVSQIPKIKEVVSAYKIPMCQLQGYEADDIIATLAEKAKKNGFMVTIVTSDKDALQLVDEKVRVLNLQTSGDKIYNRDEVQDKYGVYPESMVDLMALMGDASDNIPGVKGIGKVSAGKLVSQYGGIQGIYENIDKIASKSIEKKLIEEKDMAELSRELVELDRNVPVDLDLDTAKLTEPDTDRLQELYQEFEFRKLLRDVAPKEIKKGTYSKKTSPEEVKKIIQTAVKLETISVSTSRGSQEGEPCGVSFSWKKQGACFIPISGDKKITNEVKNLLENEAVRKIGHDIKEDILILRSWGVDIKGPTFDVMIADYLIDPSFGKYNLSDVMLRHLGHDLSGETETDSEEYMVSCEKSDMILQLYDVLNPILEEKELIPLFKDVEMPLVETLADMEYEGVGVDIECLKKQSAEIATKLTGVSKKIYELAGEEFNINSPKQLQVILYGKLGLPALKKTKTGISTDESVLRKLVDFHELPKNLLKYREMNKLKTGYYDSISGLVEKKTLKLHARFNQAVTATGRLSSSEPNLQNIPIKTELGRGVRRIFVPQKKGNILLSADYSQVELRILAHLSEDKALVETFKNEEDVHKFTAAEIFGCEPDEVTDDMRQSAKTVNFGIIYGMSSFGLAKDLEIGVGEAQKFIDAYFKRYSGVKSFIDNTIAEAKEAGFVTTLLKRRRYIPELSSSNERVKGFAERVAVNTPVQGSAADLIKLAMIECNAEFKNTDIKMLIQVHDELVFEIPKKDIKNAAQNIKRIMEGAIELKVPIKVDIKAGENWLEMEELTI